MVRSTFVSDSPDVMASAAADPADVEADLGSGSGVRCDTGVKWTMSVSLADDEVLVMVVLAVVLPRVLVWLGLVLVLLTW